jgi:hypothetical protein
LPWQEEYHTSIGCGRVKETHCSRGIIVRQGYVHSGGRLDHCIRFQVILGRVIHLEKCVREWTCSIYNTLRWTHDRSPSSSDTNEYSGKGGVTFARILNSSPVRQSLIRAPEILLGSEPEPGFLWSSMTSV